MRGVKYSYRGGGSTEGRGGGILGEDDIAVVSNAAPGQLKYGTAGIVTANGPRVVPGKTWVLAGVNGDYQLLLSIN